MSSEGKVTPGDAAHDDLQALTDEIERTRTQLGETVEELAAKADVKARAQEKVADVKARAQEKAAEVKAQAQVKAGGAKQTVLEVGGQVKDQVTSGTAQAASTVWNRMPEPVQRAAKRAADSARLRRAPLAMVVGAALLAGALIARRRRR